MFGLGMAGFDPSMLAGLGQGAAGNGGMGFMQLAQNGGGMGFLDMLKGQFGPASQGPNSVDEAMAQGAPADQSGLPKLSLLPNQQIDAKAGAGLFTGPQQKGLQAMGKQLTQPSATTQRAAPGAPPSSTASAPTSKNNGFQPPPFQAPGLPPRGGGALYGNPGSQLAQAPQAPPAPFQPMPQQRPY